MSKGLNANCKLDGTAVQLKLTQMVSKINKVLMIPTCERQVGSDPPYYGLGFSMGWPPPTPPQQGGCRGAHNDAVSKRVSKINKVLMIPTCERQVGSDPPYCGLEFSIGWPPPTLPQQGGVQRGTQWCYDSTGALQ
ncbi:hypothetical protein ABBQ38_006414 [Trebouxia sp. C0009 RCD-2024]